MFTGIIEETGAIKMIRLGYSSAEIVVSAKKVLEGTVTGDSIAVNGVCLTVTSLTRDSFTADAMPETLRRSNLGELHPGDKVNLERAMVAGGRFGGHIVAGHVDACGKVLSITESGIAKVVRIGVPHSSQDNLLSLVAVKGSVAVDGASLTVVAVDQESFSVSLIPHTFSASTLGFLAPGDTVNVEADVLARYVARVIASADSSGDGGLTLDFLQSNGF